MSKLKEKIQIGGRVFTFSAKLEKWSFHVAYLARTWKKCTELKKAREERAKLLFLSMKYANFEASSLQSRRSSLNSLMWLWQHGAVTGGWVLSILSHFSRNFRFQVRWYSQFQSVWHEICRTMSVSSHLNHCRESPRLDFCNRKHCYTGHFSFRDRKFRWMEITAFSSPEPQFLLVTWSEKRNDILSLRTSGSGDENEITPSHWSMNSL